MDYLHQSLISICVILLCMNISSIHGIINGKNPLNDIKYVVTVLGGGLCSGGIIGNKHILTAAHCIKVGKNNKLVPVKVVAATNSSSNYNTKVSIVKYVRRAFVPAAYAKNKQKLLHDIAVLELTGSIQIEKNSYKLQKLELPTPIKLNPLTYPGNVGKEFKAAGFGSKVVKFVTDQDGKVKPKTSGGGTLQVGRAIVLDNSRCKTVYGGTMENRMCYAIIEDPKKETFQGFCSGDSGTPIVVDNNIVVGVHSAGGNCNTNRNPDIGIKTIAFMPFIKNAMSGIITADMQVYNA